MNCSRDVALFIDDDFACHKFAEIVIKSCTSLSYLGAYSAVDSLKLFGGDNCISDRVALIIMDYLLPEIDGVQLMKILKGHCPQAKFILQSGFSNSSVDFHDFDYVLCKPYSKEQLLEAINLAYSHMSVL